MGKCAIVHVSSSLHSAKLIYGEKSRVSFTEAACFLCCYFFCHVLILQFVEFLSAVQVFIISLFDAKEENSSPANFSSSSKFVCVFFCLL